MKIKVFDTIDEIKHYFGFRENGIIIENDIDLMESECDLFERKRRDAEVLCLLAANCSGPCLDIGTSYGRSAAEIAANNPHNTTYTVNLLPEQIAADEIFITHLLCKEDIGSYYRSLKVKNIEQIYANTSNWAIPEVIADLGLVFIDGNHDTNAVLSDSNLTYDRVREGGFILWHDFSPLLRDKYQWINSSMTGVEQFIERNSLDVEILHLKNSWIGIMVKPTSDSIILPHISNTTHSSTTPTPNHYKMLEWTDEKVQKFWNYESQFPENYFTYQVGKSLIHSLAEYFSTAKSILDYGCGIGFLIPHMLELGLEVSALDFSPKSIEKVNNNFKHHRNFMGAYTLDQILRSKSKFDVITLVEVLEHLNSSYLSQTIDILKNVLSHNGIAIITTPNNESLENQYVYCPQCDSVFHRWQHVRSWSIDSLSSFLISHDLNIIDSFSTDFVSYQFDNKLFKVRSQKSDHTHTKLPHLVFIVSMSSIHQSVSNHDYFMHLLKMTSIELINNNFNNAKKYISEGIKLYPNRFNYELSLSRLLNNNQHSIDYNSDIVINLNSNSIETIKDTPTKPLQDESDNISTSKLHTNHELSPNNTRILLGYSCYNASVKHRVESWLERLRANGIQVDGFCLTINPPGPCIYWPELDDLWKKRDHALLSMYDKLAKRLESYDVLVNWNGINLHPEFVRQIPIFKAYSCFDDPEASHKLSRPVAWAYDLALVGNIAEVDTYYKWGVKEARHWPLGFFSCDYDHSLTRESILNNSRDVDIALLCERIGPWRRDRLEKIAAAFPQGAFYGQGWPNGFLPDRDLLPLYQRTKIGINIHNSTGPINFRTFILPANGIMQLCDNKANLARLFELNSEVVGFDSIEEAIDLCHYYLKNDDERRHIAAAGWERALKDYNEVSVFKKMMQYIEEVRHKNSNLPLYTKLVF